MKFCSQCGAKLLQCVPADDNRVRHRCEGCGWVHYVNPKVVVAATVYSGDRVLWIKRATPPQQGFWALPSGFMETGETLQAAACRELYEETGIKCREDELWLYSVGTLDVMDEVHVNFRVPYRGQVYARKTDEALEIQFFSVQDLPWQQLAYPVLNFSSQGFYAEMHAKEFGVYVGGVKMSGVVEVEKVAVSLARKIEKNSGAGR